MGLGAQRAFYKRFIDCNRPRVFQVKRKTLRERLELGLLGMGKKSRNEYFGGGSES